jgi:hypothetical protein
LIILGEKEHQQSHSHDDDDAQQNFSLFDNFWVRNLARRGKMENFSNINLILNSCLICRWNFSYIKGRKKLTARRRHAFLPFMLQNLH